MPLEDYIIHVFCLIDDLYQNLLLTCKVRKSGYSPILADSEIISMLVVGEFLGFSDNKKIWLYFKSHYLGYFPSLDYVRYKIFNKQATCLWHVIRIIHSKLLTKIGTWSLYLADGIPFPVCHLARAKRSRLFKDKVARHYCAAKKEHYYGFKILLVTTESGIPIDYAIDAANVDERILLTNTSIPANSTVIADKGFISEELALSLQQQANITLLTPKRRNMLRQISGKLANTITSIRKRIETSISQLTESFSINATKARSFHGLLGRINRKILSYTAALFFNYQLVKDQFTQLELLIQA
jgi:hypothetical protein